MKNLYSGFTLLEVLLVVSIISIIGLIGVINISEIQSIFKVQSAGDEIRALIRNGREMAIANNNLEKYQFSLTNKTFALKTNNQEIGRYQLSSGISASPGGFTWNIESVTGYFDCLPSCQIVLISNDNAEVIKINKNNLAY